MGNEDGMRSALTNYGNNKIIQITAQAYFSFAFGNEIALVLEKSYFILNCDAKLWKIVGMKVKELKTIPKLRKWWKKISNDYQISNWSGNFNKL